MKKKIVLIGFVIVLIAVLISVSLIVMNMGFTGVQKYKRYLASLKHPEISTSRVYVKKDMERIDNFNPPVSYTGEKLDTTKVVMVTINLYNKGIEWIFAPERKRYAELPIFKGTRSDLKPHTKYSGNAQYAGYKCELYKEIKIIKGAKCTIIVWWSPELNYTLKWVEDCPTYKYKLLYELSNIKKKPLSDSLFKLPSGYKKVKRSKDSSIWL